MLKSLLLLICLPLLLFSLENDPYELAAFGGEPTAIIGGCVSAITGDVFINEEDLVVAGKEPIVIRRKYFSRRGEDSYGGWEYFFNSLTLTRSWILGGTALLKVPEKQGFQLFYISEPKKKGKGHFIYNVVEGYPDSLTNCYTGEISGRLNTKNNRVFDNPKEEREIIVEGSNGSRRCYHRFDKQLQSQTYRLTSELLPNRNVIHYKWALIHDVRRLTKITSTDPSGKEYAWVKIDYDLSSPKHLKKICLTSSDGQSLTYHFNPHAKNGGNKYTLLKNALRPTLPNKQFQYWKSDEKGFFLSQEVCPDGRKQNIHFYTLGQNLVNHGVIHIPNKNSKRYRRVKLIQAPVGSDEEMVTTHQLVYKTGKYKKEGGYTTVTNAQGDETRYNYNKYFLLTQVRHCIGSNQTFFNEHFHWHPHKSSRPNWLKKKVVSDACDVPILIYEYQYDNHGNVTTEKLIGNLTGEGSNDSYTIHRTFYPNHLLQSESFPNGKSLHYAYLGQTDLTTAKYIHDHSQIKIRNFYQYSGNVLVKEILDDGSALNIHNLSDVSERFIKEIASYPNTDLPHIITEFSIDLATGRTLLLRKKVLHYDSLLQVEQIDHYNTNDELCYSLHYKYDEKRRMIQESNPLGQITTYSYDDNNNLVSSKKANEAFSHTTQYDCANRPHLSIQKTDSGYERRARYSYNTLNQRVDEIDYQDHSTTFSYDPFGNITKAQSPLYFNLPSRELKRAVTLATYSPINMPLSETDPKGNVTKKEWTIRNKPYLITYPDQTQELFVYDISGNLAKHTNSVGTMILSTFDFLDRLTSKKVYSKKGTPLSEESYEYNSFHLLSKTAPDGVATQYTYDHAGRVIQETTQDHVTQFTYDSLGHIEKTLYRIDDDEAQVHVKKYDLLDRVTKEREEDLQGKIYSWTEYGYDVYGNQTSIKTSTSTETFSYDLFRRLTQRIDPLGNKITIDYDDHFQSLHDCIYLAKTTTDPNHNQTFELFNYHNQPVYLEKLSPDGETLLEEHLFYSPNQEKVEQVSYIHTTITKKWDYNARGHLISLIEENGKTTSYAYTPEGHLKKVTKPDNTAIKYSYDPLGRLETLTSPDLHYTLSYDRLGNIVSWTDGERIITRKYDHFSNLLKETLTKSRSLTRDYDLLNRPLSLTFPDGSSAEYTYDPYHLLSIDRLSPDRTLLYSHQFLEYDLRHNPTSEALANETLTTHEINPLNRVVKTTSPYSTEAITAFDGNGNVLEYIHDSHGITTYSYDPLNQITSESGLFPHTYSYDSHHNRLSKDAITHSYNALHQLIDDDYKYDLNGNLLQGEGLSYTYDSLDRLTSITSLPRKITFTYDYWNRLLSASYYLLSDNSLILQKTEAPLYDDRKELGTQETFRILNPTSPSEIGAAIAIERHSTVYVPIHDLFGNIIALLDNDANPVNTYKYNAFGEELIPSHPLSPWRYQSKRKIAHLSYFGHRFYHPHLGRWLTPDPKGFTEGPNLYQYTYNNPLFHTDLYGLSSMTRVYEAALGITHGACDVAFDVGLIALDLTTLAAFHFSPDRDLLLTSYYNDRQTLVSSYNSFFQNALPDPNSPAYHFFRDPVHDGINLGLVATGVYALGRSATKALATTATRYHLSSSYSYANTVSNSNYYCGEKIVGARLKGYTKHGLNQAIGRNYGKGVKPHAILDTMKNPIKIASQSNGRLKFVGKDATIILSSEGKLITTYGTPRGPQIWNESKVIQPSQGHTPFMKL